MPRFAERRAGRFACRGVFLFALACAAACSAPGAGEPSAPTLLRIGVPEEIDGNTFGIRQVASGLSLEGLTQLSPDGRALPKLAESWWWEDGGRKLEVNLRKNVAFHDGTPLTATLVAGILQKATAQPGNTAQYISFGDIEAIRASGDLHLTFDLRRPSSLLPEDLDVPLSIGQSPPIGTGPYRIASLDRTEISLEANKSYYLGIPQIQRVVVRPFSTLRTAWSSLLRGELDTVTNVPPEAVEFVSNDDVQVVSFGRRYQHLVAFNSRRPPFDNVVVRRALNSAIDRASLVTKVLQGRGSPSTGPFWPQHWAYDKSLPGYGFDPALASSLLDRSGFPEKPADGRRVRLRFTCLIPMNFAVSERIGLEIQKQLYDIGVDMQFEVVPAQQLDQRLRSGKYDAVLLDLLSGPTLGRPYMFWGSANAFSGLNLFGYDNAEAERLFGVLRSTTNEGAVRSATRSLQGVMIEDPPALFLAWNQRSRAVRRNFQIVHDDARDPADPLLTIWKWTQTSSTVPE